VKYSQNPPDFDQFSDADKSQFLAQKSKQLENLRQNIARFDHHPLLTSFNMFFFQCFSRPCIQTPIRG
jgi:hypothetical protein